MKPLQERVQKLEQRVKDLDFKINIIRQIIHTEGHGSDCPGCEKHIQETRETVNSGLVKSRAIIECPISCSNLRIGG